MGRFWLLVPILGVLAGCGADVTQTEQQKTAVAAEAENKSEAIKAYYKCDGTLTLDVVFHDEQATVTLPDGDVIELPIAVSGSGFRYATPRHELRGKGTEATWTIGRRMPIECHAVDEKLVE